MSLSCSTIVGEFLKALLLAYFLLNGKVSGFQEHAEEKSLIFLDSRKNLATPGGVCKKIDVIKFLIAKDGERVDRWGE